MDDYQKRMAKKKPKVLPCGSCGELLYMTYMPPGSNARCRNCGADNIVPDDSAQPQEATPTDGPVEANLVGIRDVRRASYAKAALRLLAGGALFYIGFFVVSIGPVSEPVVIPLSSIGRLGSLFGLLLLLFVYRSRLLLCTAVIAAPTQGYDAWSFQNRELLLEWLSPAILFLVMLVIRETAGKLGIYDRLAKSLRTALILLGLVVTASFLFLLFSPLLNPILQRLYEGNETLLAIAYTVGSLPFVVLALVSAIMVIVVVVKVLRTSTPRILPKKVKLPATP